MTNSSTEQSDDSESVQVEPRRSVLRWALIPTALFGYFGLWHLWNAPMLFFDDLPRSGGAFVVMGVCWLYCARCWWFGKIMRALFLTFFLGPVLSYAVVSAPESEKEFLRDAVETELR